MLGTRTRIWTRDEYAKEYEKLKAENAKLKRLCGEINRFFKSIGTILDADHIRKAYGNSSTKAEIEQALSGGSKDRKVERSNRCETQKLYDMPPH